LDWSREQFTLSERNFRAVRKVFKELYERGKIYKDSYMTNWCPSCQTVLSDLEVNMKEEK
jgi:valyl-tRNA synthetase